MYTKAAGAVLTVPSRIRKFEVGEKKRTLKKNAMCDFLRRNIILTAIKFTMKLAAARERNIRSNEKSAEKMPLKNLSAEENSL